MKSATTLLFIFSLLLSIKGYSQDSTNANKKLYKVSAVQLQEFVDRFETESKQVPTSVPVTNINLKSEPVFIYTDHDQQQNNNATRIYENGKSVPEKIELKKIEINTKANNSIQH
jgi:hypothetical protein